jgi:hypothetical protein
MMKCMFTTQKKGKVFQNACDARTAMLINDCVIRSLLYQDQSLFSK